MFANVESKRAAQRNTMRLGPVAPLTRELANRETDQHIKTPRLSTRRLQGAAAKLWAQIVSDNNRGVLLEVRQKNAKHGALPVRAITKIPGWLYQKTKKIFELNTLSPESVAAPPVALVLTPM